MLKKILILIAVLAIIPVQAANYELKELIPVDIETTIVTNNFSYKDFYYNKNNSAKAEKDYINFKEIKNLTKEEKPISITVAFFNKDKKNIGTMNYCSEKKLNAQESTSYSIEITKNYLGKEYSSDDIKYISVLSDNKNCRTTGSEEFIGQTVKEIGMTKNTGLDSHAQLMVNIFGILGIALLALFVYKFLFTSAFQNVDGQETRKGFEKLNRDLEKERQEELRKNPPKPKEPKKIKTDEVLEQEEAAKHEDKTGTDLHNLYK